MAETVILHHYDASPFSEKIRKIFGLKRLKWRAVEQPSIMPKPDLVPLTGGYRRIPVLQIGADVYCDTQVIVRLLERLHPAPTLYPGGSEGTCHAWNLWADRLLFLPLVAAVFAETWQFLPPEFIADRTRMAPGRDFGELPTLGPPEPNGLESGDAVSVVPDDYGLDPVAGELVFSTVHEIAVRRRDAALGEIVVHFPRFGFRVTRGA